MSQDEQKQLKQPKTRQKRDLKLAKTTQRNPKWAKSRPKMSQNKPKPDKTTLNNSKRAKASQNYLKGLLN